MILKYARKLAAGNWTADGLPQTVGGLFSSIALDSSNNPHISHYDLINYDLKYTYKDGSVWRSETADSLSGYNDQVGKYTSIALDSSGYPHISHQSTTLTALRYAYKDGAGWHAETVNDTRQPGTSIALDTSNRPHIVSSPVGEIRYSYKNGTWTDQIVDEFAGRGEYCSLALGSAHISYYEGYVDSDGNNRGNLRYAYRDPSGWHPETVEKGGNVGRYTSLALAGNGYPHIGYSQLSTAPIPAPLSIKYAYKDAAGWHIESVESCECLYASLALESTAPYYPHIAYRDGLNLVYNFDLRYAYKDATGWHTEAVDTVGNVGQYASLALDGSRNPHISYYDLTNTALKYAYKDASGWHIETAYNAADVGMHTSLALNGSGYPHISYYDSTNTALKYAYKDGSGWHAAIVDNTGSVGTSTSIALDSSGYPHISYLGNGLKYAYQDAAGWHIATVHNPGNETSATSIALDANNRPHISYYSLSNFGLKYAYSVEQLFLPQIIR